MFATIVLIIFFLMSTNLKNLFIVFLSGINVLFCLNMEAASKNEAEALAIAQQFYNNKISKGLRSGLEFQLAFSKKCADSTLNSENPCLYAFNAGDGQGFVIVSGNDAVKSILAFSDKGKFPSENEMPENLKYWLEYYSKEISCVVRDNPSLMPASTENVSSATVETGPLLGDIRWGQGNPYNYLCPYSTTKNELSATGCVATAMAQIMKYYKWPVTGTGSNSYSFNTLDSQTRTISVNFGQTKYKWDKMLDSYGSTATADEDTAAAQLVYHCGVAVNMQYGIPENGGSSATSTDAGLAFKNHFGYDEDLQSYSRMYFTTSTWNNMIIKEIDAGRPVIYSGSSDKGGHTFVCDGYNSDGYFHINWGWDGNANGYYELNILNPDYVGTGGSADGYSQDQEIITGIQKPDNISNPTYNLGIYQKGVSSDTKTISNLSSGTFNLTYGYWNYGLTTFNGSIGAILYKDGSLYRQLSEYNTMLQTKHGSTSASFTGLSLKNIASGTYQLYIAYKPNGSNTWYLISGNNFLNNHLNVTINGNIATITTPNNNPQLRLAQTIKTEGKIYKGKTCIYDVNIKNDGSEFYSYLTLKIYSASNSSVYQVLDKSLVDIQSGQTASLQLTGSLSLSPGNYNVIALYDSTNNFSESNYKTISQDTCKMAVITVNSEPGTPVLTLTKKIDLGGKTTFIKNEEIGINAEIKNTGGCFSDKIITFLFRSSGGYSVGYIGPELFYIDSLETKSINMSGTLALDTGSYFAKIYYVENGYNMLSPGTYSSVNFRIIDNQTGTMQNGDDEIFVYPDPVKESVNIKTDENVLETEIYDINGRKILGRKNAVSLPAGKLNKGMYLLKVTTNYGKRTFKFIKQ